MDLLFKQQPFEATRHVEPTQAQGAHFQVSPPPILLRCLTMRPSLSPYRADSTIAFPI